MTAIPAVRYVIPFVGYHPFGILMVTLIQLLTGYGELMLTEFKYGFVPKESFSAFVDQVKRRR